MSKNLTPDLDHFEEEDDTPFFMGSGDCGCALSESENDCISRKLKTLIAEGKSKDQALAIAISMCKGESAQAYETAKEKQRSKFINPDGTFKKGFDGCVEYQMKTQGLDRESAEKLCAYIGRKAGKIKKQAQANFADKPALPGGDYEAVQNPDGSWNINDVPIFAEHTVRMGDGKNIEIGKKWMEEALVVARSREAEDRYLPPLHIHHHGTGRDTKLAGFFRLKDVRETSYQGKPIWAMFADLVAVPAEIYDEIKKGRLPYRSVEIHRVTSPSIDSCAIMPDTVPFFRLPMLTVGDEKPVGLAQKFENVAAPALAYRAQGNGYSLLSQIGGSDMASEKSRAEVVLAAWEDDKEESKEEGKIEINVEENEEISESLRSRISKSLRELLSLMEEEIVEDEEEEEEVKEEAPAPVDMALEEEEKEEEEEEEKVEMSAGAADVQLMARLDSAERDLRQIQGERKIESEVAATFADLEKRGLADDPILERLTSIAEKDGLVAMRAYADALREFPVDPPSRWTGDFGQMSNDVDVAQFDQHGPEASEKAAQYAKEFDALKERGLDMSFTRADHISSCLRADGFKISDNGRI